MPVESLRLRFALLQSLNTTLETFFLPLVELRQTPTHTHSIAALLKEAKGERRPRAAAPEDTPTPGLTLTTGLPWSSGPPKGSSPLP